MGRHSRGAGEPPAPLPDPPTRHPYAPRSAADTGGWDGRAYRVVVDVGPPAEPRPGPGGGPPDPRRYDDEPARPRRRHGATRADLSGLSGAPRPGQPAAEPPRRDDPAVPAFGGSRLGAPGPAEAGVADRGEPRFGGTPSGEPRFGATRADVGPVGPGFGGVRSGEPRFGATRADLVESGFGGVRSGEPRFGATRADLVEPGFGGARSGEPRFGATRPGLVDPAFDGSAESGFGGARSGEPRFSATRADLAEPAFGGSGGRRFGAGEARLAPPAAEPLPALAPVRADLTEPRFGATRADLADSRPARREEPAGSRYGATRADLARSVGSTALAPRPAPDPDEVTDTGARRARSTFRLAAGTTGTTAPDEDEHDDHEHEGAHDEDEHDEREPALILQWGIFVAQTVTGAVVGLGVWLGFYRLWSTWPFYAVPAVGVAAVGMLVLARALRRRHGRDLDLLTAAVTAGVITVLTVLPAAFTLQGLTQ